MCKINGEEEIPNRKRPIEEQFLALANFQSNNNNNGYSMDTEVVQNATSGWPKHVRLEV